MEELLGCSCQPYKFVLTYTFTKDHIKLFFNKIWHHGGWNNNPNVLDLKYVLCRLILETALWHQILATASILQMLCVSLMAYLTFHGKYFKLYQILAIKELMIQPLLWLRTCWFQMTWTIQTSWEIIIVLYIWIYCTLCWQRYNMQTVELNLCLMLMTLIHFNSHPIQCLQDSQLSNWAGFWYPYPMQSWK